MHLVFIDSHSHIEMVSFDQDRHEVIERAVAAGVEIIVDVGNGEVATDSHAAAFRLAEQYPFVYTTVGVHPHEASLFGAQLEDRLLELAGHSKVIAWGEIGLDYHYDNSPRDVQCKVFRRQLRLARERKMPIVIHTREAEDDTLAIIRQEWAGAGLQGIIHCFTGTWAFAEQAVDLGFLISFSGVVTFKTADDLRRTAAQLPLNRILIETDSPFLTPAPFRGKRNEPAFVVETGRFLASLREVSTEEFGRVTSTNFRNLFKIENGVSAA
ncbi:MAG TPA: TatD family hydrolase [Candidatus Paceibacterota bacterium]|nr:TatD family hydrolase [Candidatus Paceibacterota bacterium]